ncbi:hypothetical protein BpHYR1_000946, partial [Brachionus plicatilis]
HFKLFDQQTLPVGKLNLETITTKSQQGKISSNILLTGSKLVTSSRSKKPEQNIYIINKKLTLLIQCRVLSGHLVRSFSVMGRHLNQPVVFNLNYLSHVLLRCENKLIVDNPSGQRFKQTRIWMNVNSLLVFGCLIGAGLAQFGRMVEKASSYGLANRDRIIHTRDQINFNTFHQASQLVSHISSSFHRSVLNKVLKTPLCRKAGVFPLLVNIQQGYVIAGGIVEVLSSCVSKIALFTDSMEQMVRISSEHLYFSEAMSVFESIGSTGNSAIRLPSLVSSAL